MHRCWNTVMYYWHSIWCANLCSVIVIIFYVSLSSFSFGCPIPHIVFVSRTSGEYIQLESLYGGIMGIQTCVTWLLTWKTQILLWSLDRYLNLVLWNESVDKLWTVYQHFWSTEVFNSLHLSKLETKIRQTHNSVINWEITIDPIFQLTLKYCVLCGYRRY
jgi:hypothetical protein